MKQVTKLVCVFLSIFTLIGVGYSNITKNVYASAPAIVEYRITGEESKVSLPRISGNKIVYEDSRDGNANIYVADITDPNNVIEKQVTSEPAWQSNPDIYGNIIVWDDMRHDNQHEIYMADISDFNNIIQTRVTNNPGKQNAPDIYENNIAWEDFRNGEPDIYMADVTNKSDIIETQITTDSSAQYAVGIYGNIVVWEDRRNCGLGRNTDIYMTDISDLSHLLETRITSDSINGSYPQVSGNKVIWYDFQGSGDPFYNNDIYVADVSSLDNIKTERITDSEYSQFAAEIDGNVVVWVDQRTGAGKNNIYMADVGDMDSIVETQISSSEKGGYPAISGNKIVWSDVRDDTHSPKYIANIYLATFTYPDTTVPTFSNLPNNNSPINIDNGQFITTNPFIIKVKPTDNVGISNVKFYVDDNLICTATAVDANGVYSCAWDTSKYHSVVKVVAYDTSNNPTELLSRTTLVDPVLYIGQTPALTELPATGKE